MKSQTTLKWKDLVSPTMAPDEYLKTYGDKVTDNYKTYEPKSPILEKIKTNLKNKKEKLKIVALGADWCPDCSVNIPRMIKVVKMMKSNNISFYILYGIMVDAFHKPGEIIWHKKRSPPEALDPKFDLKAIPSFYLFNADGEFLDVIIEHPKTTIEEDILEIIKKKM